MKIKVLWCLALLACVSSTALVAQIPDYAELGGAAAEPLPLEDLQRIPDFLRLIDALAQVDVHPAEAQAYALRPVSGVTLVPLTIGRFEPDTYLFLYYLHDSRQHFFLQLRPNGRGSKEARLWADGPSELLISEGAVVLLPEPTEHTFRLGRYPQTRAGHRSVAEEISVGDAIACLARTLGVSLNPTNLSDFLNRFGQAACSSPTIDIVLTAISCLDPLPLGILGCTIGAAKLIACNVVNCPSSSSCLSNMSLGQRINDSFATFCTSRHRTGSFAKYYVFTLSAPARVRIDLEAIFTDTFLFLLSGNGSSGGVITADDDSGFGWNARIERILPAGTYTIEATTYGRGVTGGFTLALTRL